MKTWRVWGNYFASKYLGEVEAETEYDALREAEKLDYHVGLCHQCAEEIDLGDLDDFTVFEEGAE